MKNMKVSFFLFFLMLIKSGLSFSNDCAANYDWRTGIMTMDKVVVVDRDGYYRHYKIALYRANNDLVGIHDFFQIDQPIKVDIISEIHGSRVSECNEAIYDEKTGDLIIPKLRGVNAWDDVDHGSHRYFLRVRYVSGFLFIDSLTARINEE